MTNVYAWVLICLLDWYSQWHEVSMPFGRQPLEIWIYVQITHRKSSTLPVSRSLSPNKMQRKLISSLHVCELMESLSWLLHCHKLPQSHEKEKSMHAFCFALFLMQHLHQLPVFLSPDFAEWNLMIKYCTLHFLLWQTKKMLLFDSVNFVCHRTVQRKLAN